MYKRPFFWIAIAITALFALVPGIGGDVSLRESLVRSTSCSPPISI
jgi:hypothetical protein